MKDTVFIVGGWADHGSSTQITIQDVLIHGASFIPIFSDEATFKDQIKGSGLEAEGVEIDRRFLLSLLKGDERFLLNAGSRNPVVLTIADLTEGPLQEIVLVPGHRLPD